jgi:nitrogen regulatory protein P-II 1
MKKIEAYIQPFMLSKTEAGLRANHIHGMTVIDARGFGREKDESYPHHTTDFLTDFTPKTKIEIFCNDDEADTIAEIIGENARTGRRGDGKIFISAVEKTISIRTGVESSKEV